MSRPTTHTRSATPDAHDDRATPSDSNASAADASRDAAGTQTGPDAADAHGLPTPEEVLHVPMLEEPSHLPGTARASFSPLQFLALSRVERRDVAFEADDALWLTEEDCPKVTPEGIDVYSRRFFHEALGHLVDHRLDIARPTLKIRYDRALLARGVLDEVRVYRVEADGSYTELCRCSPREQRMKEIDLNQVLRHREQYINVLLAKISEAEGARVTLREGTEALQRLRDEQAARRERQRRAKHAPIAAAPLFGHGRRAAERREAEVQTDALSTHLAQTAAGAAPGAADDDAPTPVAGSPAAPEPSEGPSGGRPARRRGRTSRAERQDAPEPVPPVTDTPPPGADGEPSVVPPEDRLTTPKSVAADAPSDSLAQRLGGTVGFHAPADDE